MCMPVFTAPSWTLRGQNFWAPSDNHLQTTIVPYCWAAWCCFTVLELLLAVLLWTCSWTSFTAFNKQLTVELLDRGLILVILPCNLVNAGVHCKDWSMQPGTTWRKHTHGPSHPSCFFPPEGVKFEKPIL